MVGGAATPRGEKPQEMAKGRQVDTGLRHFWGIFLLLLAVFVGLSLFSYDWRDVGILRAPPNDPPCNWFGPVGAWTSFVLFMGLGVGAHAAPLWCVVFGLVLALSKQERIWPRAAWGFVSVLSVVCLLALRPDVWAATCAKLNIADPGGVFGRVVATDLLVRWLSPIGTGILAWMVLIASLVLFIGIGNLALTGGALLGISRGIGERVNNHLAARQGKKDRLDKEERQIEKRRGKLERTIRRQERLKRVLPKTRAEAGEPAHVVQAGPEPAPVPAPSRKPKTREITKKPEPAQVKGGPDSTTYELPGLALLPDPGRRGRSGSGQDVAMTAQLLQDTLGEFGVEAEVTNVETGPVVTSYELLPAPGVRVERIQGLSNNLALALKATSVRVQAPIPGKGVVGIEVPNSTANLVYIREIFESSAWNTGKLRLPLALGKNVSGEDLVADLADMPHLLIAGATGSGKTVCMNSILAGLLMSRTPEQLRLMLVDPKIVEFSAYNHLPHLVVPVVTDPKKVALGLRWAINEMEQRYRLFAKVGVRNIESYNHREIATQENLFDEPALDEKPGNEPPAKLPYIVIVIDELADLMLVAQAEIENCVARLAQLSRAVGIHMVIATQRPSVNVITGTIKANFPARIAFQVAQKVDSRTILDSGGADKLLGRGDMLFQPPGSNKLVRAQGAMTTDAEIRNIVDFIKSQAEPAYEGEIKKKMEKNFAGAVDQGEDDEMLSQAIDIIRETHRASTSSLQRRLRIGYTRAARIMDILEERGIIGSPRGSDPREILIDLDGDIPDNAEPVEDE